MSDIITTLFWYDTDNGWTQTHYWIYDDGTYTKSDTDGNHEDIDQSDVPSCDEAAQSWREYSAWVAKNGDDPLGEFYVPGTLKKTETWQVNFRRSILGTVLQNGRKNARGPFRKPEDLPGALRSYLLVEPTERGSAWVFRDVNGDRLDDLRSLAIDDPNCTVQRGRGLKMLVKIEVEYPNPNYRRDLVKIARKRA